MEGCPYCALRRGARQGMCSGGFRPCMNSYLIRAAVVSMDKAQLVFHRPPDPGLLIPWFISNALTVIDPSHPTPIDPRWCWSSRIGD
eukprot:9457684-Pyramimonas_sp.AAC.1